MSYDETHAARIKDYKTLGMTIKNTLMQDSSQAHNSIPKNEYLGEAITAAQLAAIKDGTFKNLFLGGTWIKDGYYYQILGFNYHLGGWLESQTGLGAWKALGNHIAVRVFAPFSSDIRFKISEEATCPALYNSYMHNTHFPQIIARAEEVFGAENIIAKPTYICDSLDENGRPNHFIWSMEKVFMPTTAQWFGVADERTSYPKHNQLFPFRRYDIGCEQIASGMWLADFATGTQGWGQLGVSEWTVSSEAPHAERRAQFYILVG